MFKNCPRCLTDRQSNTSYRLEQAKNCLNCQGTGVIEVPAVNCNQCGQSTMSGMGCEYGLINAKVFGGYESIYLNDLTKYQFSLCEQYLRIMFNGFKIPPTVEDVDLGFDKSEDELFGPQESYLEDKKIVEKRLWVRDGGELKKALDGYCNFDPDCNQKYKYRLLGEGYLTKDCRCEKHVEHKSINYVPVLKEIVEEFPLSEEDFKCHAKLIDLWFNSICQNKILFKAALGCELLEYLKYDSMAHIEALWIPKSERTRYTISGTMVDFESGTLCVGSPGEFKNFRITNYQSIINYFPQNDLR